MLSLDKVLKKKVDDFCTAVALPLHGKMILSRSVGIKPHLGKGYLRIYAIALL